MYYAFLYGNVTVYENLGRYFNSDNDHHPILRCITALLLYQIYGRPSVSKRNRK